MCHNSSKRKLFTLTCNNGTSMRLRSLIEVCSTAPTLPWQRAQGYSQCLFTAFSALCLSSWDIVCCEKVESPWSKNQSANCASLLVWSPLWSLFPCQVIQEWRLYSAHIVDPRCWLLVRNSFLFTESLQLKSNSDSFLNLEWQPCVVKWKGFSRCGWFLQEKKHLGFGMRSTMPFCSEGHNLVFFVS